MFLADDSTLTEAPSPEPVETSQEGAAPAEELEATPPSSESSATDDAPSGAEVVGSEPVKTDDEIRAEIEAELRAEYDKRLTGLQSAKDREIAQLRQQHLDAQQLQMQQAEQLMQTDPKRAAQLYQQTAQQSQAMTQQEQLWSEWQGFVASQIEAAGQDVTKPDVQQRITDETQALFAADMSGQRAPAIAQFQTKLMVESLEAERGRTAEADKRADKAIQDLEKMTNDLPGMIDQALTRKLAATGTVPEATDGQPPAPLNPNAREDFRKLSAAELKRRGAKKDDEIIKQQLRAMTGG